MTIDQIIDATIGKEGGYSNHPSDKGGPTMWGITERVARKHGYGGDMRKLPRATAVTIYRQEYAIDPGFAAVAEISAAIGEELFDTGVNMGPRVATGFLQRALNALNRGASDYPDVAADGRIGPATLGALDGFLARRENAGERVLLKAIEALQGERYVRLAESKPANEAFLYGWLANRIG